jgi:murein DD-endopeptidase MepM/ murein hydrolase activator NlpD
MAEKKKRWISLMIIPEDGTHVRNWRISSGKYLLLKAGVALIGVLLVIGVISILTSSYLVFQLHHYRQANDDLMKASSKLEIISARLSEYEQKEAKLRDVLGGDLKLPTPMAVQESGGSYEVVQSTDADGLYDLQEAIGREESRIRRIPTIWPVDGWQITEEYSNLGNARRDHLGIDIVAYEKSPVVATADGRISFAGESDDLGLMVEIDLGNGWITRYVHNATLLVAYGDEVIKGQTIAVYGGIDNSGSGPHLHYAMLYNKKSVNPLDYLEPTAKMNVLKKK